MHATIMFALEHQFNSQMTSWHAVKRKRKNVVLFGQEEFLKIFFLNLALRPAVYTASSAPQQWILDRRVGTPGHEGYGS